MTRTISINRAPVLRLGRVVPAGRRSGRGAGGAKRSEGVLELEMIGRLAKAG